MHAVTLLCTAECETIERCMCAHRLISLTSAGAAYAATLTIGLRINSTAAVRYYKLSLIDMRFPLALSC